MSPNLRETADLPRGTRVLPENCFPWLNDAKQIISIYRQRFMRKSQRGSCRTLTYASPAPFHLGFQPNASAEHFYPVISIFGSRGVGKTSAMLTLLQSLQQQTSTTDQGTVLQRDIILPPIDPNRFVSQDKLMNWLLAELLQLIQQLKLKTEEQARCHSEVHGSQNAIDIIEKRYQQLSDSFYQLVNHSNKQASSLNNRFRNFYLEQGTHFSHDLNLLIEDILTLYQSVGGYNDQTVANGTFPLMILPIDDADLVPEFLDDLLQFLRVIAHGTSRLVIVTTIDLQMATTNRKLHYLQTVKGEMAISDLTNAEIVAKDSSLLVSELIQQSEAMAEQFLTKFFPLEGRFAITPFNVASRLNYWPPQTQKGNRADNANLSIYSLLQKFNINTLFTLPGPKNRTESSALHFSFNHLIPSNQRLLEEFYLNGYTRWHNLDNASVTEVARQDRITAGFSWLFEHYQHQKAIKHGLDGSYITDPKYTFGVNIYLLHHSVTPYSLSDTDDIVFLSQFEPILGDHTGRIEDSEQDALYFLLQKEAECVNANTVATNHTSVVLKNFRTLLDCRFTQNIIADEYSDELYPSLIPLLYRNGDTRVLLPLPPWRFPLSWMHFDRFWSAVIFATTQGSRVDIKGVLTNLIWVICHISVTDLTQPNIQLQPRSDLTYFDTIDSLKDVYIADLQRIKQDAEGNVNLGDRNTAGIVAHWFEFGLLPFLAQANLPELSVKDVQDKVLNAAAKALHIDKANITKVKQQLKQIYHGDAAIPLQSLLVAVINEQADILGPASRPSGGEL